MLERELALAGERRARPAADEVSGLEHGEVGRFPVDQLAHRAAPEDPADHRRRLEGGLVDRREEVDSCGEHCLHRVGDLGLERKGAVVDAGEQLLEEERVALGAVERSAPQLDGGVVLEQRVQQALGLVGGERLQPDRRRVPPPTPGRVLRGQLGPRGPDQRGTPVDVVEKSFEQVEERLLGPVEILHEHDDRPLRGELREQLDPGALQLVARRERMQFGRHVEAEREAEDLAAGEPAAHGLAPCRSRGARTAPAARPRAGDRWFPARMEGSGRCGEAAPGSGRRASPRAPVSAASFRHPRLRSPSRAAAASSAVRR